MGRSNVGARIENTKDRDKHIVIPQIMVDTGSVFSWIPEGKLNEIEIQAEKDEVEFRMANGKIINMTLLGARTLEGLNLMVDPARKRLVAAGPLPAAPNS